MRAGGERQGENTAWGLTPPSSQVRLSRARCPPAVPPEAPGSVSDHSLLDDSPSSAEPD